MLLSVGPLSEHHLAVDVRMGAPQALHWNFNALSDGHLALMRARALLHLSQRRTVTCVHCARLWLLAPLIAELAHLHVAGAHCGSCGVQNQFDPVSYVAFDLQFQQLPRSLAVLEALCVIQCFEFRV